MGDVKDSTKDIIESRWNEFVTCEEEHPCCEISETMWGNTVMQIDRIQDEIRMKEGMLEKIVGEMDMMRIECVDVDFDAYDDQVELADWNFENLSDLQGQISANDDEMDIDDVYIDMADYDFLDLDEDDYTIRQDTI